MNPARLSIHITARLVVLAAVLAASAAFAQPTPDTAVAVSPNTTAADIAPAPGLPGPQSVDPAPGARGAYAGHSQHAFYDVDQRIDHVQSKILTSLTGAEQKRALSDLAAIKSEEKAQIAKHGDLLDWARESLNHRIDTLLQTYPPLVG